MNIGRSSLKIFLANAIGAGANFLGVIIFSRELGASLLGIFFLFEAILGIVAIPANFGLRDAVEKRISEGTEQGAFLTAALLTKLIPLTIISAGILLYRPSVNSYLGADLAVWLVIVLLFREYGQLSLFILRGKLRVGETAILQLIRQVGWLIGGVLLIQLGYGVESLVYSLLLGYGLVLTWGWHKVSINIQWPTFDHVRSLFDYSKFSVVSSIGGYFYNWMDVALIGLFLTQEHVGAYEISWRVTMVVMLFSSAIATTIFPQVSRWDAKETMEQIENLIPIAITYSMLIVVPAFFGTLVLSRDILSLVFDVELDLAWLALIILMGEKIFQSIHVVIGRSLQAIDQPELAAFATILSIIINFVLNIFLILEFGIIGAAIATMVSFTVNTVLHTYYLGQFIYLDIPYKKIGWILLSAAGMSVVVRATTTVLTVKTLPKLIGLALLGTITYTIIILLFRPLRVDIRRTFHALSAPK